MRPQKAGAAAFSGGLEPGFQTSGLQPTLDCEACPCSHASNVGQSEGMRAHDDAALHVEDI